jgi:1-carboxybiuret hydrolase subunit AtzG-like protein
MYLDSIVESPIRVSDHDVERLAALVGLPISPSDLPNVAVALGVLLTAAQLVSDFPLPDDVEAAPVFRP